MSERKKSWQVSLPEDQTQKAVSHRFQIAGSAAGRKKSPGFDRNGSVDAQEPGMVSAALRDKMVARIARAGVADADVLNAMRAVPRHVFVDAALASRAYEDSALPIGHGQTISQPYIVARMVELLRNGRSLNRVLEVGTGCGYQAAVLGTVAKMVFSIERVRALHEFAKANLRPLRMANVRLQFGDGMQGLPSEPAFDGIIIAAAGLGLPNALLEQLVVGGRLVGPLSLPNGQQRLVVVDRTAADTWEKTDIDGVNFVPLLPGTV